MTKQMKLLLTTTLVLLSASGCQKTHVLDTPLHAALPYLQKGDTVVFDRLTGNLDTPYWIVFGDSSPCAEKYYKGTRRNPPQCKVTANSSGENLTYFYKYSDKDPSQGGAGAHPDDLSANPCWYCEFSVGSDSTHSTQQPDVKVIATGGFAHSIQVCDGSDPVPVIPALPGDLIQWSRNGVPTQWQIQFSGAACSNGTAFSHPNNDICIVGSMPGTYSYTVTGPNSCKQTGTVAVYAPQSSTGSQGNASGNAASPQP